MRISYGFEMTHLNQLLVFFGSESLNVVGSLEKKQGNLCTSSNDRLAQGICHHSPEKRVTAVTILGHTHQASVLLLIYTGNSNY